MHVYVYVYGNGRWERYEVVEQTRFLEGGAGERPTGWVQLLDFSEKAWQRLRDDPRLFAIYKGCAHMYNYSRRQNFLPYSNLLSMQI